jgi:hypothetical protein
MSKIERAGAERLGCSRRHGPEVRDVSFGYKIFFLNCNWLQLSAIGCKKVWGLVAGVDAGQGGGLSWRSRWFMIGTSVALVILHTIDNSIS